MLPADSEFGKARLSTARVAHIASESGLFHGP